ncbi:MAG: magnesium and cobalt transport protein CorA [Desulfobacteraceae bacterium]|nr:MAG: magnesium and cobalt transport protein CorA [Desulfobacteraceae bacterium]
MVSLLFKKTAAKIGAAPGTLMHIGQQRIDRVRLSVIDYDENNIAERTVQTLDEALAFCDSPRTTWLNVDGIHDTEIIARIGRHFNIHPLTLEDILHTDQRPKLEDFGHYLYIVLQMLRYLPEEPDNGQVISEQVSLILTPRVLISFQESAGDIFAPVRERLHKGRGGRIRASKCDYLAYTLIDAIVDYYFVILEHVGADVDAAEEDTIEDPRPGTLERIHDLKREMITLRRNVWPLRDVIAGLSKQASHLIDPATIVFLRDVHDHTIQIIDTIESNRDILSGLLELYLTNVSNRMNEVMKVLTIIATIFIPVTFIAGVYGMNFKYMPELQWRWGYPAAWGLMIAVIAGLLFFFKKKKWL